MEERLECRADIFARVTEEYARIGAMCANANSLMHDLLQVNPLIQLLVENFLRTGSHNRTKEKGERKNSEKKKKKENNLMC